MILRPPTLVYFAVAALGPAIVLAQSPPERDGSSVVAALEQTLVEVIAKVEPSVVAISRTTPQVQANADVPVFVEVFGDLRERTVAGQTETVAAGVIIDPKGLVLTEFLAVRQGDSHTITTTDGQTYPAEIKAADPRSGLAVLAINQASPPPSEPRPTGDTPPESPAPLPAIAFGDAAQLRKGQFVIAIGNPYAIRSDGEPTASWGIVANVARKAAPGANFNNAPGPAHDYRTTLHHLGTLIQTDAALGWSAGGGALVDLRGELVGLTTSAATIAGHEQPAGYATPINATFRRIIDTLKEGREVEYGLLGVSLGIGVPVGGNVAAPRVTIQHAYAGSPGERAGLQAGDVIARVDGKPVTNVDALQLTVSLLPPSTTTTVEYERGGATNSARVTLAKLGVAGDRIVTQRSPAWRGLRVDYATALDALKLGQAIESGALDPQGCVLVSDVEPDSDASRAGVRAGMFISHVGGKRVATPAEFFEAAKNASEAFDVRLTQPIKPADAEKAPEQNSDSQPPRP